MLGNLFNSDLKAEAIEKFKQSVENYKDFGKTVQASSTELFVLRKQSSEEVIGAVEAYINTLANTPKEFDHSFAEYKAEFRIFNEVIDELQIKSDEVAVDFGTNATAGVIAGVGTAALAPAAAMAIATTFGTASTGTAIAVLSGAAAKSAALAWLGGGALAAGGSGMAGGSALLALAGPIGWAIGGTAIVGGGLLARSKNKAIANDANAKCAEVETLITQLKAVNHEVSSLISLTKDHIAGVKSILNKLKNFSPANYLLFIPQEKDELGALINHIRSLSKLLNKKVLV